MCSICKTVNSRSRKKSVQAADNPSIVIYDSESYDVKRVNTRRSGRHIMAAEHTGVKPCVVVVGNKPNGRHIHE